MNNPSTRRDILKNSAIGLATLVGSGGVASGKTRSHLKKDVSRKQLRKNLIEKYGNKEGALIYSKVLKYTSRIKESDKEVELERLYNEIKEDQRLENASVDIRSVQRSNREYKESKVKTESALSVTNTQDYSINSIDSTELTFQHKYTDTNAALNTRAEAEAKPSTERLYSVSNSALAGSGNATARIYDYYYWPDTDTYDVSVTYYRKGMVFNNSGAELSFYTYDNYYGVQHYELETIGTTTKGHVTKAATGVKLESGTSYQMGIELRTHSNNIGSASYADFYNDPLCCGRRQVNVDNAYIRKQPDY